LTPSDSIVPIFTYSILIGNKYILFKEKDKVLPTGYREESIESLFNKMVKWLMRWLILPFFRVSWSNRAALERVPEPYLILSNHGSALDPYIVSAPLCGPCPFILTGIPNRYTLKGILYAQAGAIPMPKNCEDLKSLKLMMDALKKGKNLSIFPEESRTWDGKNLPVVQLTANLIRILNVPVVTALLHGSYLMNPRWGTSLRRGKVVVCYNVLFGGKKTGSMKIHELEKVLIDALDHNEYESEIIKGVKYKSFKRAEKIEQILYICPDCHSVGSFISKGNRFRCRKCGYSVYYSKDGQLFSLKGKQHFINVAQWNDWQKKEALNIILTDHGEEPIFFDSNITHSIADHRGVFRVKGKGSLYFYKGQMEYRDEKNSLYIFNLEDIAGMAVQLREKIEFTFQNELHRFHSRKRIFSARKIMDFYNLSIDL